MSKLRVGDRFILNGRTVVVTGFSPMSVTPTVVYLKDPQTDERLDVVLLEEIEKAKRAT